MNIRESTERYEQWMAARIHVIEPDLIYKHEQMAASPFAFMRATFYRWFQLWNDVCADEAKAAHVLAVGDLHIENFGTWRDAEGRLIWGVNDFDEAYTLPYTHDLVRLAASAELAIRSDDLKISGLQACDCILEGYVAGIRDGGRPFVLEEHHAFLRDIALNALRDPAIFWEKMNKLPDSHETPKDAAEALQVLLPASDLSYIVKTRRAGLGSLGRERFVALAEWRGGMVARETKAAMPSACTWLQGRNTSDRPLYSEIFEKAIRVPDPFLRLHGKWIVRRLAPHCSRIDLSALPQKRDESRLLHAMGRETANIHLGSPQAIEEVQRDLDRRADGWLFDASKRMVKSIEHDWEEWKKTASRSNA